jgi:hypothetical protein
MLLVSVAYPLGNRNRLPLVPVIVRARAAPELASCLRAGLGAYGSAHLLNLSLFIPLSLLGTVCVL